MDGRVHLLTGWWQLRGNCQGGPRQVAVEEPTATLTNLRDTRPLTA